LSRGDYAIAYCRWLPLAERGLAEAQYNIGWLYANGNGLAVNIERAMTWWLRAARQGHADAQFAVALALTTGEGVEQDLAKATEWYLSAARLGHADAREILLELAADPALDLLGKQPGLVDESWFGWTARVVRDRINVRGGPGVQYPVVKQLEQESLVRVIGSDGDWWRVVIAEDNTRAHTWIYRNLLRRVDQPG
jgi:TPR repeat protein